MQTGQQQERWPVIDMATFSAPRAQRRRQGTMSLAARRAMEAAAMALTDAVPALLGDDALAERERLRREDELKATAQRELGLGGKPWA